MRPLSCPVLVIAALTLGAGALVAQAPPPQRQAPPSLFERYTEPIRLFEAGLGTFTRPISSQSREAQWRPCRLRARPMLDAAEWMEPYREHWEQRLDRLDDYLREASGKPALRTRKKK